MINGKVNKGLQNAWYNSYNPFDFGPDYPGTKMQILPFS